MWPFNNNSNNHSLNSLEVEISKKEFLQKPLEEQNWILFQAICHVDKHGCRWRNRYLRKVYILGAIMGLIGGFLASLIKLFK